MEHNRPTPRDVRGAHTGEALEAALVRVENLAGHPLQEHVAAFEDAHRALQEHLNEAADG